MDLRVENLPVPVERSLYQEAIDTYLELSHRRIEALYAFGTTHYPGLSDLDMLVVPRNGYLDPLNLHLRGRLPPRFDAIIEHEVFVVPQSHLQACRYVEPGPEGFRLVYGSDVLRDIPREASLTTGLCETVEFVHNKLVFLSNLRRMGALDARSGIRVFNSHRYTMRRLVGLGLMEENGYGAAVDALRTQLAAAPSPDLVREMYRLFETAVAASARTLQSRLDLDPNAIGQVAAVSQGRVSLPFDGYRIGDARERAEILTSYLQELVRRNYWYGFPFLTRLFPPPRRNSAIEQALFRGFRSCARRARRLRSAQPPLPAGPPAASGSRAPGLQGLAARTDPIA